MKAKVCPCRPYAISVEPIASNPDPQPPDKTSQLPQHNLEIPQMHVKTFSNDTPKPTFLSILSRPRTQPEASSHLTDLMGLIDCVTESAIRGCQIVVRGMGNIKVSGSLRT
jgi:hypothetical protein